MIRQTTCGATSQNGARCGEDAGHHDDHCHIGARGQRTTWMNYAWSSCIDPDCKPCVSYRAWHGIAARPGPEVECCDCGERVGTYFDGTAQRVGKHGSCVNGGYLVADNVASLKTARAIAHDDALMAGGIQ